MIWGLISVGRYLSGARLWRLCWALPSSIMLAAVFERLCGPNQRPPNRMG
jgi:hypothetical protein